MIVVDASTWVSFLVGKASAEQVEALNTVDTVAPPHVDFEVGCALRRMERHGQIDPGDSQYFITMFSRLPCDRLREPNDAVAALRFTDNASYADAWYLALADRLDAAIMTTDKGMITSARIHELTVIDV